MKPAILLCMVRGVDHVAEALLARADIDLICLHEAPADELTRKGIPNRRLNSFMTDELYQRVLAQAEMRGQTVARVFGEVRTAVADDLPAGPLNQHLGMVLQRDFPEEILLVDILRHVACETDLRLIVTPEDICRDTRTIISAAHRIGVPALHVMHGFPSATNNAHDMITADVVAAFSDRAKRIYESFGARPDRVIVTGNPFWDIHSRPPRPGHKQAACAAIGLDPSRPIIEYALTNGTRFSAESVARVDYHLESADVVLRAFADLAAKHPDWQFLVRPHPSEAPEADRLIARARDAGVEHIFVDIGSAYDAVTICDVLLCTHSNMGIEAILHGKPVVNVAIDDILGRLYVEGMGPLFLDEDAVLWARSADDVAPLVEAALCDKETQDRLMKRRPGTIERFNYRNDGKATERMAEVALEMMSRPNEFCSPLDRFPDCEPGLAGHVPGSARQVLVVGRGAAFTADAIRSLHPDADVVAHSQFPHSEPCDLFDAVVLAEPVANDGSAEATLRAAKDRLVSGGRLVAVFRNGRSPDVAVDYAAGRWAPAWPGFESPNDVGQFSWSGVEVLLSRCGLESDAHHTASDPEVHATPWWAVSAWVRGSEPSDYSRSRAASREAAAEMNETGETRFAEGDVVGALGQFAKAAQTWAHDARIFNNLAVALHAVGKPEDAWRRAVEALSIDPCYQAARDNLRFLASETGREAECNRILGLFGEDADEA